MNRQKNKNKEIKNINQYGNIFAIFNRMFIKNNAFFRTDIKKNPLIYRKIIDRVVHLHIPYIASPNAKKTNVYIPYSYSFTGPAIKIKKLKKLKFKISINKILKKINLSNMYFLNFLKKQNLIKVRNRDF